MVMPSGGRRPGAGRKPSAVTAAAKNKIRLRSRELIDQAAQAGVMPLQVQLETMRALYDEYNVCLILAAVGMRTWC